ncbi:MAG TPA: biosynthetic peptidoglycan transglycosylase [Candidatus Dormibacteraeota bacterium]|nr:biosynthetic peptidoglycan transglycosylase [Candidatus Dormibacteraeota bacterium]
MRRFPGGRGRRPGGIAVAIVLGIPALLGLALAVGLAVTPPVDDLSSRVDAVLSAHGATRVSLDAVPDRLSEALISIEDERFYSHHGVDSQGLVRALFSDIYHRRALEGASTLSQQLVKNLYMNHNDDGWRKPEDVVLAIKLESKFSKHQILESYLNSVYFGHGAYGVGQAAEVYFHKRPAELDLAQASMLAGLPQSPSYYDLYRNPCAARARHFAVLAQMVHDGYINAAEAAAAYNQSIGYPCK